MKAGAWGTRAMDHFDKGASDGGWDRAGTINPSKLPRGKSSSCSSLLADLPKQPWEHRWPSGADEFKPLAEGVESMMLNSEEAWSKKDENRNRELQPV